MSVDEGGGGGEDFSPDMFGEPSLSSPVTGNISTPELNPGATAGPSGTIQDYAKHSITRVRLHVFWYTFESVQGNLRNHEKL